MHGIRDSYGFRVRTECLGVELYDIFCEQLFAAYIAAYPAMDFV
jgi:hypothetical protein